MSARWDRALAAGVFLLALVASCSAHDVAAIVPPDIDMDGSIVTVDAPADGGAVDVATVDAGAAGGCGGPALRVTSTLPSSYFPALAWTGSELALVWIEDESVRQLYFARVAADASAVLSMGPIATARSFNTPAPSLAWNGAGFGVAWNDTPVFGDEVSFAELDPSGAIVTPPRVIPDTQGFGPDVVWTGTDYGLAWEDLATSSEQFFVRVDASGVREGAPIQITNHMGTSRGASLEWTGSEFGVAWTDQRMFETNVYFAIPGSGGEVRVSSVGVEAAVPSLAWNGAGYGAAWGDARDGNREIYFARLTASGAVDGAEVRLTNDASASERPVLVWTGTRYGLAWNDGGFATFAWLDPMGARVGTDVRLSALGTQCSTMSLVWTGSYAAIAWCDTDAMRDIYVKLVCP